MITLGSVVLWFVASFGGHAVIPDDSPLFDCRVMGNEQCGPDSHWRFTGYW
jgi:hypothetical protein